MNETMNLHGKLTFLCLIDSFMTRLLTKLSGFFLATFLVMPAFSQQADLVLRGGKIITVDDSNTIAEAIAVVGNRIAEVGSIESIEPYIRPGTQVVDLDGATLLPGFIDAHNHVEGSATGQFFRLPV